MMIANHTRDTLTTEELFFQKIYWLNQLSGELPETNIITDYVRPATDSANNKSIAFQLSKDLSFAIAQLTNNSNLSIYLVLLSALSILMQKYTGNNDIILGSPIYKLEDSDRNLNTIIPLRINLEEKLTFKDFLLRVKETTIDAYSHQNYLVDELVQILNLPDKQNRCPFCDVVILLENIHQQKNLADVSNDLTFSFKVSDHLILGTIDYNESVFREDVIKYIIKYYINILESVTSNCQIQIADIPLLKAEDKQQLLEFNNKVKQYPIDLTIDRLFEQQVEQTPLRIAVDYENTQLTYQQLNEKANQLARLLQKLGLNKDEIVGIYKERDINFLIGILAIQKAGGAYVPIDSQYPPDRVKYMVSNSEVKIILTDTSCLDSLSHFIESCSYLKSLICLETPLENKEFSEIIDIKIYNQSDFNHLAKENLEGSHVGTDIAYMLYTSGSTGLPKGAIVRHDGAINHIYAQFDELELTKDFRFLQSAPSSTDISVWQFLAPLLIGGQTVIVDTESGFVPDKLFKVLQEKRITVVELVPAVFGGLLDYISQLPADQRLLPDLKWMMVVGEPVSVKRVNQWLSLYPAIKVADAYGPTEAADDITQFIIEKPLIENQRTVPIGKPLANLNLYILDREMQLVPIGFPGEICVSGIGVGEGYWKNEEKTKLSFVPNPFPDSRKKLPESNKDLIYKTGDLGRWLPDGNIEFLGRIDNQVKIRGFRVELEEIEALLRQHPAVRETIVIVREETGDKRLVAYVVTQPDQYLQEDLVSELRNLLKQRLPQHMIPSAFVLLESFPLAPSGKVDRRALPAPDLTQLQSEGDFIAPSTPVEEMLAGIWAEVLGIEKIGIHDNFFELGGHSLLATRVISKLRQVFQIELPLRSLFENPTVGQLAQEIERAIKVGNGLEMPPITRISREEDLLPSFAQQRLWFLAQLEPDNPIYNIPGVVKLQGNLNITALEQSLNEILRRHEALRSNFKISQGRLVVAIAPPTPQQLSILDMSELTFAEQEAKVRQLTQTEAKTPFNFETDSLVRLKLLRLNQQEHVMLLTSNYIASDAWSAAILVHELSTLYNAFCQGQPSPLAQLPIQYPDFAAWQQQWMAGEVLESQLAYWQKQLAGAPTVLDLPTDHPRPAVQTFRGATYKFEISPELSLALKTLSQQEGCTLFMTVLAAFKTLLYRYSGSEDIIVGSPIANRNRAELEGLIGPFLNTLVLRTKLGGDFTFQELLSQVRETSLGAYAHQDLPFEQLVEVLQPERSLSHTPLFQVMFVLQNAPKSDLELIGLTSTLIDQSFGTAKFDLIFSVLETAEGLSATFEYSTDLFETDTISRMAGHLQTLLEAIVANPEQELRQLPLLTPAEQQQLLEWNDTQVEYSQIQIIHQLFEAQVERTPDAIAAVFEERQLTYRELNARANQLAHYLQTLGVKPEVLVGICVERSLEMAVGILGILKAGAAYVPLDPQLPQERLSFMLNDSQVKVLLTQQHLVTKLTEHQTVVVCLDSDWQVISQSTEENLCSDVQPSNLAYVIYTSGSTGKPKGVAMNQLPLCNLIMWQLENMKVASGAKTLQFAPVSFDVSFQEMFSTWCSGGTLYFITEELRRDPKALLDFLNQKAIERLFLPFVALQQLAEVAGDCKLIPSTLREIITAGEQLQITPTIANLFSNLTDCTLHNHYGPSESHVITAFTLTGSVNTWPALPPIGQPINNTQIYILDSHLRQVPVGVPGELHIGGISLARGYLNRPELTQEKFIPFGRSREQGAGSRGKTEDQSSNSERLYKTGDLARYLPNGEIEYIGRIDYQVKVRGFRIELGEIEAVINQHPQVRECVVVVREDEPGSKYLTAYAVLHPEQQLTITELRHFLESKLPNYMVPTAFMMLESLPLTPNGKVNRRALPTPDLEQLVSRNSFVAPSTPIEEMLAGIWAEVLNITKVGIHDNFFELGGHSLLATRVTSKLRQVFKVELPVRQLFESPTIADLAKDIERVTKAGLELNAPPITCVARSEELLLSFAQQRLWFLAQLEPGNPFYNIPGAIRLQGQLNQQALHDSLNEILRRHEVLRTTFKTIAGQPIQVISSVTMSFPVIDLSQLTGEQQEAKVKQLVQTEAQQPFNLETDLMIRAKLLRLDQHEHVLLLTFHHIASDGWSIGVFVSELSALYSALCNGQPAPLPELPIQYADFAAWQRKWLATQVLNSQFAYWQKQLAGAPAVLELPTDHPRPAVQTFRGGNYSFQISPQLTTALQNFSQQQGCTLFMTLLAAFKTLLYRYSGSEDIVVGSPIANRNHAQIEELIGFFVNTLVLRTKLESNFTFEQLLTQVREVALGAYSHQDLPFESLVEKLQLERSLSHTPLFQVMFVLQNAPHSELELPGLDWSVLESDSSTAKFDLTLFVEEANSGLKASFEYNTDLFEVATIERMVGHLQRLLEAIVANPQQQLWELPLLTEAEKVQFLEWNNTKVEYPKSCIHQLFEAQVERTPDAVAVAYANQKLTYRELNTRANQLAHYLQKQGVKPQTLIGICAERSLLMIVGLLGILKVGCAYVPLDPDYPQQRLALMIEQINSPVLLTQQHLVEKLSQHQTQIICLDSDWQQIAQQNSQNPNTNVTPDDVVYVIYTSGSTGKPKGAINIHQALCNRLLWMQDALQLTSQDRVLQKTPFSFDVSVWEFFWPLITGASLVFAKPDGHRDSAYLVELIASEKITTLHFVPSMLQVFLTEPELENCHSLKRVICSGEALSVELEQRFFARVDAQLYNLYGPTEAAIDVTWWHCHPNSKRRIVPIGRAIANTQIHILDKYLQPVPVGVPGELHIGGVGLAKGYLHREDLTAEKFIANPFKDEIANSSPRLYKTGDRACYAADGTIEYLGRIDFQVKIRGFRIELGEIEAVLGQYPQVREVVVVASEDEVGWSRLVAYIVQQKDKTPTIAQLRQFLESKLPNYMVPAAFVMLEALPLMPNGKVNRQALPAPNLEQSKLERSFVAPQTTAEEVIAGIWGQVLGLNEIGIHDNFFELGGHSLMVTQVTSRLRQVFQVELPIRNLFESPTVAGLIDAIAKIWGDREVVEEIAQTWQEVEKISLEEVETILSTQIN